MCAVRMALRAQTARPCRPTGLELPNLTDFLDFLLRSFKIATTACVACGGMRRLLEWSLGAASDDHAALDGGLSMWIGKRTAGNQWVSQG